MAAGKKGHADQKHFVLVHGACLGAWSWYKVKPLLESAGHRVTAVDLAASGINMSAIQDVHSMSDYSQPLLKFLQTTSFGPREKVVLVGHSLGGLSLAAATDKFPEKIAVNVFLSAFMPDTIHQPSYVMEKYFERATPSAWLDTQFEPYETPNGSLTSMFFGPKFFSSKLYQLSPVEDLELAKTLARPSSMFIEELSKANKFSEKGYGSVPRVYTVNHEDKAIEVDFQRWMIQNGGASDVFEIRGADHMAMISKPQEVCDSLVEIANKYA